MLVVSKKQEDGIYPHPMLRSRGQESTNADTAPFEISEGRFVTYTPVFRYLGTLVEYTLLDNTDIDSRIQQAQGAFEYKRPVLLNKKIPRRRRAGLFYSLIVNVAHGAVTLGH